MSELHLAQVDPDVAALVVAEEQREFDKIRLIPSENYVSRAVLEATGSVFTNKYSEGYAGKRYYEGQQCVDPIEQLAIERAKALFGAEHANVQPYSGSPANLAVYFALLKPGDTVMGMALPHGGHLTHGWNVSITGTFFRSVQYGVQIDTGLIDYDQVRELARQGAAEADHRGRDRVSARHRLPGDAGHRRRGGRPPAGGHGPHRGPGGRRGAPDARSRTPTSCRRPPTRRCAGRAAPCSCARRRWPRPSTRRCSRGCRAGRTTTPPPASPWR